jgi:hypothetical protein
MDDRSYLSYIDRYKMQLGVLKTKQAQKDKASTEVSRLKVESDILIKSEKVLKALIDKLAMKDLSKMDKLVTYGLNTVFHDRNVEFRSKVVERGRRVTIELQTLCDGNEVDPSSKSSIDVVESFLLRILCLLKLKRAPLLIMDEAFSAVDTEYIDELSGLVSKLATKLKLDILLVTHNPGFSDSEHMSYRMVRNPTGVEVQKIK